MLMRPKRHKRVLHRGSPLPIALAMLAIPITPLATTAQVPAAAPGSPPVPQTWKAGDYYPPRPTEWPHDRIAPLFNQVSTARLRQWHDLLASEPHVAGSPGDERQIERIATIFAEMGLEVEKHDFWAYLCEPVAAVLEIVEPGDKRTPLVLKEKILPEDLDSSNPDLSWGWNAYSGSGDVIAEVVYCNRGTKADFAMLKELGVDLTGKIALCRYGGNFRGYKVKFAQAAGAVGVVIFTDPAKPDEAKTPAYPAGGAQNDTCIERGSIVTTDYPGDPLTPGIEATRDAARLDPATVALPKLPVQPIGWGPAREIMLRMASADDALAPSPELPSGWQGGMNMPYRIVGGPAIKLRLKVEQTREIVKSANIIGTLPGKDEPDQWVLVGSHHDAWGFGACDPTSGTICTLEAAAVFCEAARVGDRPRRTMKFCCWGAEEFGIVGSTEWVESRTDELSAKGVAYINLDASVLGPNFSAAAAPSLKTIITEVTRHVPAIGARFDDGGAIIGPTVFDSWISREPDVFLLGHPKFGDLGGGSDHIAFWCRAGVPSAAPGSGGAFGSAYHSVYDTLKWYRQNVSDDYEPARMVTQVVIGTLARLAGDEEPPLDNARIFHDFGRRLHELAAIAEKKLPSAVAEIHRAIPRAAGVAKAIESAGVRYRESKPRAALAPGGSEHGRSPLHAFQQSLNTPSGLPFRAWFRNELASPDADSGYSAWVLPRLTRAIDRDDAMAAKLAAEFYNDLLLRAERAASADRGPANEPPTK